ncbi:MAG: UDP-glucose 4-epimerase GalE, partial [Clostridiaceae bacterium]
NNVTGTLILCSLMEKYGVYNIVFSSSATVYGANNISPFTEDLPLSAVNPYGNTKLMIERILNDIYASDNNWSIAILRYFNPIGAHESGKIGEDPSGIPNNLVPYMAEATAGKREKLHIYGGDYNTKDGTGVRDYIHVVDLAKGHLKALNKVLKSKGVEAYNLGTGIGISVLDVVKAFEKVSGRKVPYIITGRRAGDIEACFADPGKANRELGWKAEKTLEDMCRDAWRWQENKG